MSRSLAYSFNNDELAEAMLDGLGKDFATFKRVAHEKPDPLIDVVKDLISVADKLDYLNEEVAVAHLENAIDEVAKALTEKGLVAEKVCKIEEPRDVSDNDDGRVTAGVEIIQVALLEMSDKLDKLGLEVVANHVDHALGSLFKKCDCACK